MYEQSFYDLHNAIIKSNNGYTNEQQLACNELQTWNKIDDVKIELLRSYRIIFKNGKNHNIVYAINAIARDWVNKFFTGIS